MSALLDPYKILGVSPSSSRDEIARAYRQLAKEWHPDLNPGRKQEATDRMTEINLAWEILSNSALRRHHAAQESSPPRRRPSPPKSKPSTKMPGMPAMVEVESSAIFSAGHDGGDQLYIMFLSGGLYVYEPVPPEVFRALLGAPSKGQFVIREIVNGPYRYERLA